MKTLIKNKEKEAILLGDKVSDRLQIWMVASLLNVNSNKTIKKKAHPLCLEKRLAIPTSPLFIY